MLFNLLLLLLASHLGQALPSVKLEPRPLDVTSSHRLQNPAFSHEGHMQCDTEGNLFFAFVDPHAARGVGTVVRLSSTTDSLPVLYQIPAQFGGPDKILMETFYVSPSGSLWLLSEDRDGQTAVFEFGGKGDMTSRTILDAPAYLVAQQFAVSSDGVFFVAGYFDKGAAAKNLWGKRYMAIFDASGRLRRDLAKEAGKSFDLKGGPPTFANGAAVPSNDGSFYFLRSQDVVVLSEYGEVLRTIPFQQPSDGDMPDWLELSDGMMSLEFATVDKDNHIRHEFLLLDSATGAPYGLYTAADLGAPVCFSRREGYTFLHFDAGKAEILTALWK